MIQGGDMWSASRAVGGKGRAPVAAGRELQDAVKEVLAATSSCWFGKTAREQGEEKEEVSGPTPRRLLHSSRRLRLRRYLQDPGTVGSKGQIPHSFCFGAVGWQIPVNPAFMPWKRWAFTGARNLALAGPFPRMR